MISIYSGRLTSFWTASLWACDSVAISLVFPGSFFFCTNRSLFSVSPCSLSLFYSFIFPSGNKTATRHRNMLKGRTPHKLTEVKKRAEIDVSPHLHRLVQWSRFDLTCRNKLCEPRDTSPHIISAQSVFSSSHKHTVFQYFHHQYTHKDFFFFNFDSFWMAYARVCSLSAVCRLPIIRVRDCNGAADFITHTRCSADIHLAPSSLLFLSRWIAGTMRAGKITPLGKH